ncbi:hypothetical protein O181_026227 [Austropuccinia psidii MF-1]|uniref:Uncharacterized protein n=1 Tax=Austropuccinia psidii MF-1 TaxID=1389203 RepID=A0A9Q3CQ54_9BASI|nr:hypothetical protein [Austropuccinia psidii MF-1]
MVDQSNFNVWLRNMIDAWTTCFIGDEGYFTKTEKDKDYQRNLIALSFIHRSVKRQLFDSVSHCIVMPNARTIYQAIKKQFSKSSWSSIIHHANMLFCHTPASRNINQHEIELGEAVRPLKIKPGLWMVKNSLPYPFSSPFPICKNKSLQHWILSFLLVL